MSALEKKLILNLQQLESVMDKTKTKNYEKASKYFDELVDKGLAKRRGHNLLSKSDAIIMNPRFNTSQ